MIYIIPLLQARVHLLEVAEEVAKTHERVHVTKWKTICCTYCRRRS